MPFNAGSSNLQRSTTRTSLFVPWRCSQTIPLILDAVCMADGYFSNAFHVYIYIYTLLRATPPLAAVGILLHFKWVLGCGFSGVTVLHFRPPPVFSRSLFVGGFGSPGSFQGWFVGFQ